MVSKLVTIPNSDLFLMLKNELGLTIENIQKLTLQYAAQSK